MAIREQATSVTTREDETGSLIARHVLCCGVDEQHFERIYGECAPDVRQRVDRVAWRLTFTVRLRYQTEFTADNTSLAVEGVHRYSTELAALELYLLVTCLDTLAGSRFVPFDVWWTRQDFNGLLEPTAVVDRYAMYQEEHGVGRSLRRLFAGMPTALKAWLCANVQVEGVLDDRDGFRPLSDDDLVVTICQFFYEVRRNPYTHTSTPSPAMIATELHEPSADQWTVPVGAFGFRLQQPSAVRGKALQLSFRSGLDEGTIARVIVHAATLQYMGINVDATGVETIVWSLVRLDGIQRLFGEVKGNALALDWLDGSDPDIRAYLYDMANLGFRLFRTRASAEVLATHLRDTPRDRATAEALSGYSRDVAVLNQQVLEFNRLHPALRHEAMSEGELVERQAAIRPFLSEMKDSVEYARIKAFADGWAMRALEFLIRNPCESSSRGLLQVVEH